MKKTRSKTVAAGLTALLISAAASTFVMSNDEQADVHRNTSNGGIFRPIATDIFVINHPSQPPRPHTASELAGLALFGLSLAGFGFARGRRPT